MRNTTTMADDVAMTLKMLGKKLDNVTETVIDIQNSLAEIKENTEISVRINGGEFEVPMKTNELLKHTYLQLKPGGIIDKKFEECRESHSAQRRFKLFNKAAGTYVDTIKIIAFFAMFFMCCFSVYQSMQSKNGEDATEKRMDKIEKLVK